MQKCVNTDNRAIGRTSGQGVRRSYLPSSSTAQSIERAEEVRCVLGFCRDWLVHSVTGDSEEDDDEPSRPLPLLLLVSAECVVSDGA